MSNINTLQLYNDGLPVRHPSIYTKACLFCYTFVFPPLPLAASAHTYARFVGFLVGLVCNNYKAYSSFAFRHLSEISVFKELFPFLWLQITNKAAKSLEFFCAIEVKFNGVSFDKNRRDTVNAFFENAFVNIFHSNIIPKYPTRLGEFLVRSVQDFLRKAFMSSWKIRSPRPRQWSPLEVVTDIVCSELREGFRQPTEIKAISKKGHRDPLILQTDSMCSMVSGFMAHFVNFLASIPAKKPTISGMSGSKCSMRNYTTGLLMGGRVISLGSYPDKASSTLASASKNVLRLVSMSSNLKKYIYSCIKNENSEHGKKIKVFTSREPEKKKQYSAVVTVPAYAKGVCFQKRTLPVRPSQYAPLLASVFMEPNASSIGILHQEPFSLTTSIRHIFEGVGKQVVHTCSLVSCSIQDFIPDASTMPKRPSQSTLLCPAGNFSAQYTSFSLRRVASMRGLAQNIVSFCSCKLNLNPRKGVITPNVRAGQLSQTSARCSDVKFSIGQFSEGLRSSVFCRILDAIICPTSSGVVSLLSKLTTSPPEAPTRSFMMSSLNSALIFLLFVGKKPNRPSQAGLPFKKSSAFVSCSLGIRESVQPNIDVAPRTWIKAIAQQFFSLHSSLKYSALLYSILSFLVTLCNRLGGVQIHFPGSAFAGDVKSIKDLHYDFFINRWLPLHTVDHKRPLRSLPINTDTKSRAISLSADSVNLFKREGLHLPSSQGLGIKHHHEYGSSNGDNIFGVRNDLRYSVSSPPSYSSQSENKNNKQNNDSQLCENIVCSAGDKSLKEQEIQERTKQDNPIKVFFHRFFFVLRFGSKYDNLCTTSFLSTRLILPSHIACSVQTSGTVPLTLPFTDCLKAFVFKKQPKPCPNSILKIGQWLLRQTSMMCFGVNFWGNLRIKDLLFNRDNIHLLAKLHGLLVLLGHYPCKAISTSAKGFLFKLQMSRIADQIKIIYRNAPQTGAGILLWLKPYPFAGVVHRKEHQKRTIDTDPCHVSTFSKVPSEPVHPAFYVSSLFRHSVTHCNTEGCYGL